MSRRRLIATLSVISSCLALVIALAAWTFPLKAQGPSSGIAGGVSGGVAGGVAPGISNGVAGGVSNGVADGINGGISHGVSGGTSGGIITRASADEPSVDVSTIWVDTVKRGVMPVQVRGKGTLVHGEAPRSLVARVTFSASMSADLKPGQYATVHSKNGPVGEGHITSIGSQSNDTRTVDIFLDTLYRGTGAGLEVMASIKIGQLDNVLFVGRPVNGPAGSSINLFKVSNDGAEAVRTQVKLGRASVSTIEVLDGLQEGDKVILSDMSSVAGAERVRLTDEKHLLHRSGPVAE